MIEQHGLLGSNVLEKEEKYVSRGFLCFSYDIIMFQAMKTCFKL